MSDLVLRGGTVVDGTGAPGVRADVAIRDGRVLAIGDRLDAPRVLDASGAVVAPGFVDLHTHYDAQVFWDPSLSPSCYHGVTTVIAGNCGFSIAPTRPELRGTIARTLENVEDMDLRTLDAGIPWDFETYPEYMDAVARRGTMLNFGAYLGHTALRLFVMGEAAYERAATDDEVGRMQEVLDDALSNGCVGLSTSYAPTHRGVDGLPVPSRLAARPELEALLAVLARRRVGIVSMVFGPGCTLEDIYALQPRYGVPITFGALLSLASGAHRDQVRLHRAGVAAGADVWPQVTPRPLGFTFRMSDPFPLNVNRAFGELMSQTPQARRVAYADPQWRRRALDAVAEQQVMKPRWDTYVIDESTSHPEHVGRALTDVASERGTDAFGALLDLALDEPELGLGVRCLLANDDPDEVARLLVEDHCALGLSDAGAHVGQLCDAAQATELLGTWVRERELMSLPEAVRRLSSAQADLLGLAGRGVLRPGAAADVVVFDPDTVAPGPVRRVRDFPGDAERLTAPEPVGVRHVLVNGVPIRVDGQPRPDAGLPGAAPRPRPRP